MTFDVYNTSVLKYCALAAFSDEIFLHTKSNWFTLNPQSYYVYKAVEHTLQNYRICDDTTIQMTRVNDHDTIMKYLQQQFNDNVEVLVNPLYEKMDYEINNILRDIAQGKKPDEYFHRRIVDLRDTIKTSYDNHIFATSLKTAQKLLSNGCSVDEAYATIKMPEDHSVVEYDFNKHIQSVFANSISYPIKTGIEYIDKEGGFERSNIITIGGDTGSMKTRWTLWLCLKILRNNPTFKCTFFEAEMTKREILNIVLQWLFQAPLHSIRSLPDEFLLTKIETGLEPWQKDVLDRFIVFDAADFKDVADVSYLVRKYKPDIWVLDFITMLVSGNDDTNAKVYEVCDALKLLSKKTETLGIVISQIKKNSIESRKIKVPVLDDLEWSGRLKHISMIVLMVFNPSYYDENVSKRFFYVKAAKHRHSTRFLLPLEAFPEHGSFTVAEGSVYTVMHGWWENYMKGPRYGRL